MERKKLLELLQAANIHAMSIFGEYIDESYDPDAKDLDDMTILNQVIAYLKESS